MRIQTVLIGMDFSEASIAAARWTCEHFAPSADHVLAHVVAPASRPRFASSLPPVDVIENAAFDFADTRLNEVATFLSDQHLRRLVRRGHPAEIISGLATELHADLVVIGPHGDRPHTAKFLGTTADRIVRLSPVPVLVATRPPAGVPRKILVPVDDARITTTLLAWTKALAESFDADVTLLHVLSNASYSHVASMSYATADTEADARADIRSELESEGMRWLQGMARTGLDRDRVSAAVTYGDAGDATIEMANAMGADLIVLGRRGSGLVAPALLGSTVGTVLHGVRCPVLVVTEGSSTDS